MPSKTPCGRSIDVVAIDDDPGSLAFIQEALDTFNLRVHAATNCTAGLEAIRRHSPQIIILDEHLPDGSGLDVVPEIVREDPATEILLLTAEYSTDLAVRAIKLGAADYLTKPISVDALCRRIAPIVEQMERRRMIGNLDRQLVENFEFGRMISRSPAMLDSFAKIRRVSAHFRTVLITGETGSGKELAARALHRAGLGDGRPFVACNCSAIPESLIESELFGHVKGSFTGATSDKAGLFQAANGGTLLLDEIGDMPLAQQARLLRVLQSREVRRVGSSRSEPIDVRVVAATHRNLEEMVRAGEFREDLYYRLASVEIALPPLRERKEDLPLLFRRFLKESSEEYGKSIGGISRRAQAVLTKYDWPGNIRELQNVISAACMMCDRTFVDLDDLPDRVKGRGDYEARNSGSEWASLKQVQHKHAERVLAAMDGNKLQTAKVLGVSRATLYRMLESEESGAEEPSRLLPATSDDTVSRSWEKSMGLVR